MATIQGPAADDDDGDDDKDADDDDDDDDDGDDDDGDDDGTRACGPHGIICQGLWPWQVRERR